MRRMLDTERPDAVSLVAPVERTCELACLILECGFPLLVEKPPGRTVAEVDRMIAAAGGVAHQVAFNRRFAPLLRACSTWRRASGNGT
jgi:myo-inositol 2-dehydrogenase / D-chiro-inositol 1-dehydrogenase